MNDAALVILAILVLIDIALHLYGLWPDSGGEDIDVSNPVGFQEYEPDPDWVETPDEV